MILNIWIKNFEIVKYLKMKWTSNYWNKYCKIYKLMVIKYFYSFVKQTLIHQLQLQFHLILKIINNVSNPISITICHVHCPIREKKEEMFQPTKESTIRANDFDSWFLLFVHWSQTCSNISRNHFTIRGLFPGHLATPTFETMILPSKIHNRLF